MVAMTHASAEQPAAWTPDEMRALRKRHGWSQADLAARLGLHPMSVSRHERGVQSISRVVSNLLTSIAAEAANVSGKPDPRPGGSRLTA